MTPLPFPRMGEGSGMGAEPGKAKGMALNNSDW